MFLRARVAVRGALAYAAMYGRKIPNPKYQIGNRKSVLGRGSPLQNVLLEKEPKANGKAASSARREHEKYWGAKGRGIADSA